MSSVNVMTVVYQVSQARGLNNKMGILKANDTEELRKILKACYNPYWQFNITAREQTCITNGTDMFSTETGVLLHGLTSRRYNKRDFEAHLSTLNIMSATLLCRIINKDMRFGLGPVSINKVFPGLIPQFPVQLAKLFDEKHFKGEALVSPKLDGLRGIYEDGKLYSRYGHELQGLNSLLNKLNSMPGCKTMRLDGELVCPGKTFDETSGSIRSFSSSDDAVFNVFDLVEDPTTPLIRRVSRLEEVVSTINDPSIALVSHTLCTSVDDILQAYNIYREQGLEGAVVKDPQAGYINGRTHHWMKVKNVDTVDLLVLGVEEGKGKYEGMVGALVAQYGDRPISVGGGLSDMQRKAWWLDTNIIVGKTIEVAYMEITPQGSLRHPRLKHVRGDK